MRTCNLNGSGVLLLDEYELYGQIYLQYMIRILLLDCIKQTKRTADNLFY